jgi:hypothetical protein
MYLFMSFVHPFAIAMTSCLWVVIVRIAVIRVKILQCDILVDTVQKLCLENGRKLNAGKSAVIFLLVKLTALTSVTDYVTN